ncbi:YicC/YloC family endoribonuclease [Paenibacillus sp. J2TS4]|uniref:YicC/YloC family endoribonuclease n=1 Tax=Paenibacillus sp. J2TS4 TaxID=2807194 RepID=UPI001B278CAD|nr:YicC/YloC family endoribonuclease [Paenibacillus sp. J2TS4]GIP32945.1 hypothetical protein J2TS4_21550 [Paenibacillus sp. J2TS4]
MLRSMTGFGQALHQAGGFRIQLELKSVNHRFKETLVRVPRQWSHMEERMKKRVQDQLSRGRIEISVVVERDASSVQKTQINWPLADAYIAASRQLADKYSMEDTLKLRDLLSVPDLISFKEETEEIHLAEEAIMDALQEALDLLVQMREVEGAHLYTDIIGRLLNLRGRVALLQELAPAVADDYRHKLKQRMASLLGDQPIDEQRLAMEAALMADKADIEEELTRLNGHFDHFERIIEGTEPVGRKLDFLLQEMNREANTIGSKANSAAITALVVEIKAELEKIREQVQNLE